MEEEWSLAKKAGFLFLAAYSFLYIGGSQFFLSMFFGPIWKVIVPIFANFIGMEEPLVTKSNGSGDTTFRYLSVMFFLLLTALSTLIFSILDRKRTNYNELFKWFTLLLRYFLAANLVSYGLAKVFYLQFGNQSYLPLQTNFGDISPMRLLWSFMAFSKAYTIFSGFLELIAGLFLLTRKTTLLGSLLGLGVMANVMMLNYCYDVPVKLLSTHMVFFLCILVGLHLKSMIQFFILGKSTRPYVLQSIANDIQQPIVNRFKWIVLSLYLAFTTFKYASSSMSRSKRAQQTTLMLKNYVHDFEKYTNGVVQDSIPRSERWNSVTNMTMTMKTDFTIRTIKKKANYL